MENLTRSDSAQAIIVAGFLIAVGMVVVATLLNAMVFSQNLDARGVHVDSEGVEEFAQITSDESDRLRQRVHEKNNTPQEAVDYYVRAMRNQTDGLQHMPSVDSIVVRADDWENETAWQFVQDNDAAELDADGGSVDWTMVDGVSETYVFKLNFTLNSAEWSSGDNLTKIVVTNGSDERHIYAVNESNRPPHVPAHPDDDRVVVQNEHGDWLQNNSVSRFSDSHPVTIEFFAGPGGDHLVNGSTAPLDIPNRQWIDTVEIRLGNHTEGKYELRVDDGANPTGQGPCSGSPCGTPRDTSQWVTGMIHQSNYTLTYVHPRSTHVDNVSKTTAEELR